APPSKNQTLRTPALTTANPATKKSSTQYNSTPAKRSTQYNSKPCETLRRTPQTLRQKKSSTQ
ncbi:MAG: hypothetical protein ACK5F6_13535, partial [Bacteroidota bacterium]